MQVLSSFFLDILDKMEDAISLLVVPYTLIPFVVATVIHSIQWASLGFLILIAMAVSDLIKKATRHLPYTWLKRPVGASNCNTRMNDGMQAGEPGFPSGHCTCAAGFWVGVMILTPPAYRIWMMTVGSVGILSMMWARQRKRCHTPLQTVAGVVLGASWSLSLLL